MGWNLEKGDSFLPTVSLEELRSFYGQEKSSRAKIRLLAAVKRKEGCSMDSIAEQLQVSRTAVNESLHRFQERGVCAKDDEKRSGRPRRLAVRQLKSLKRRLIKGPRKGTDSLWTTRMLLDLLRRQYKLDYTTRHVRRLMHQLGFSVQKPRPRHYKTDVARQAHFKKTSGKPLGNTGVGGSRSFFWMSAQSP